MKRIVHSKAVGTIFSIALFFVPLSCLAQDFDSTFWAQHPFKQPDSTLLNDTFYFPYHTVFETWTYGANDNAPWAGKGAYTYSNGGPYHSAFITLRANHSFVFEEGHEVGTSLTVGRWWNTSDSTICLQWNDTFSLHLCRDRKLDQQFFHRQRAKYGNPWPTRIDHWQFARRGKKLIPLAPPGKRTIDRAPKIKNGPLAGRCTNQIPLTIKPYPMLSKV
jgi:hypothetical protein